MELTRPRPRWILISLALFLALATISFAQNDVALPSTASQSLELAQKLIVQGHKDKAAALLAKARLVFTRNAEIAALLGSLYEEAGVYDLALGEYKAASEYSPLDTTILDRLANAYAENGLDEESLRAYEKELFLVPGDMPTIKNLGWMYYKTHQIDKGIAILESALSRYPADPDLEVTLGTLYSDKNDYKRSKEYYSRSIAHGLALGYMEFVAVAYYDRALLEEQFYNFDFAFADASLAVKANDSYTSGFFLLGEMYLNRAEYAQSLAAHAHSLAIRETPLGLLSLARSNLQRGRLSEALAIVDALAASEDVSWMVNFGTNPTSHFQDLYRLYYQIYEGLAAFERSSYRPNPIEASLAEARALADDSLAWYYRNLYREYSKRLGYTYREAGNYLYAQSSFYEAFQEYPELAAKYLEACERYELGFAPKARALYLLERGELRGNSSLLERAIAAFDPEWQRADIAEAYAELCPLYARAGKTAKSREAAEQVFSINRGALRQRGIALPVLATVLVNGKKNASLSSRLSGIISGLGFDTGAPSPKARLELAISGNKASLSLLFGKSLIGKSELQLAKDSFPDEAELAKAAQMLAFYAD